MSQIYQAKTFTTKATNFFDQEGKEVQGSRLGVLEAIEFVINRITNINKGKLENDPIGIMLPCRYGKSDVIRLSSQEVQELGIASVSLAIAPWIGVAKQLIAVPKIKKSQEYYPPKINPNTGEPYQFVGKTMSAVFPNCHKDIKNLRLLSATNAFVYENLSQFRLWARDIIQKTPRLPPVIFIDESQLIGESYDDFDAQEPSWERIVRMFQEEGARIVSLTGTPWRRNGVAVGFEQEVQDSDSAIYSTITDRFIDPATNKLKGVLETNRIHHNSVIARGDFEVPYKRAFDVGALLPAKVTFLDVEIDVDEKDDEDGTKLLIYHELSQSDQRYWRGIVSRHPKVIENFAYEAYLLYERRRNFTPDQGKTFPNANVKMIVITPSDKEGEGDNVVAKLFKAKISQFAKDAGKSFDLEIVTLKDGAKSEFFMKKTPAEKIRDFAEGNNRDGIGVKRMGCVGLDAPQIKVVVFIGTYRTAAQWLQTVLRGATVWHEFCDNFDLIMLKDQDNLDLFDSLLRDNGGEYVLRVSGDPELLETKIVDIKDPVDVIQPDLVDINTEVKELRFTQGGISIPPHQAFLYDFLMQKTKIRADGIAQMLNVISETQGGEQMIANLQQVARAQIESFQAPLVLRHFVAIDLQQMSLRELYDFITKKPFPDIRQIYLPIEDLDDRITKMADDLEYLVKKSATLQCDADGGYHQETWTKYKAQCSAWVKTNANFLTQPRKELNWEKLLVGITLMLTQDLPPLIKAKLASQK